MPWKGNQDNESQGSHREQSTLLKQMPALKVRAVYQIIFPNSIHLPPWHGPCRRLNIGTQKGDFLSIIFMCLPCILYSSVIFKKLLSLGKDTDTSGWKQQVARTRLRLPWVQIPSLPLIPWPHYKSFLDSSFMPWTSFQKHSAEWVLSQVEVCLKPGSIIE